MTVALATWLLPSHAAATAEAPACALASALTELTAAERDALVQTCEGVTAPEEGALQSAIFRMVSLSTWRGAALARMLAPMRRLQSRLLRRGDVKPPDLARAQASLVLRPETLAGPNCADLRRAVDTFVADTQVGEAAASPFLHDDPALIRCLGLDAAVLQSVRLIALRADGVEELFIAAAAPDFAYISWLQPRDALVFGRHRFFVIAAPPSAPMTAVAHLTNTEVPAIWRQIVSDDEVAWPESPALTCINLDVRLGPHAVVYLDGAPVPRDERGISRVLAVTRQEHEIVALECLDVNGPCSVRYREELPAATLQRRTNQCLGLRLDLGARTRPTIAVLDATQSDICREAPLRADGLRQGATDHLAFGPSRETHDFRDLAAFAAATDALSALRTRLQPAEGTTTGHNPGADGTDLLGTAAKEAWRQGIDVLLSFNLHCVRREVGWAYRLTATRVALGSMFSRGRYGGESLDLNNFIEPTTEEFHAIDRLPVALASVIDRSLGVPYLRLLAERSTGPYREGAALRVQHHPGRTCDSARACAGRSVAVRARRLNLGGARPELCRQLDETIVRGPELLAAAQRAFAAGHGPAIELAVARDPNDGGDLLTWDGRARLRGQLPGWYLVLARWSDDDAPAGASCVELSTPRREVWADVTLSAAPLHLTPRPAPDQLYARTRLGFMHYLRPIVGLGVVGGYAYTSYAWPDGRPAWQNLEAGETGPLEWQRHALLVGGAVELRTRFARLPADLRLRAAPTLSMGVLRLSRIPPSLGQFLAAEGGTASELDVDLDVHVDAVVSYNIGKVAVQHLLLLGLRAVDDSLRRSSNNVRDNGGFFLGLGFGIGGAP